MIYLVQCWVISFFFFWIPTPAICSTPSILFILTDDLGWSDTGFSTRLTGNEPSIPTPNLDKLADAGIILNQYYTHTICAPSRIAFMTGRYAHTLGNPFPIPDKNSSGSLETKWRTLAQELKYRGYKTHYIGKWGIDQPAAPKDAKRGTYQYFNGQTPGLGPIDRGFDTFLGLYGSAHNHFTKELVFKGAVDWHRHNLTHKLDYPEIDEEPEAYSTHIFAREAIEIMRHWQPDNPSFLQLSFTAPHDPLQAPPQYINGQSCGHIKNWRRATFCGMVIAIDEAVGLIIDQLTAIGMIDHTIIAFSSDNGGAPSVGGFNYPYRGQKATSFQGGVHVPAFIHAPNLSNGRIYDGLMHIADWAPTFLSLVDKAANRPFAHQLGNIDGIDQSSVLINPILPNPRHKIPLEFNVVTGMSAYIKGKWKLLLGSTGRPHRFLEPTGRWYDEEKRSRFIIEEIFCDILDLGLGPNYFPFGWAARFRIDRIFDMIQGTGDGLGTKVDVMQFPMTHRIEVNDANLPSIDWEIGLIKLYDLNVDPYENDNIAYLPEHKELVEELITELREMVQDSLPQHIAIVKQFLQFNSIVNVIVIVLLLCTFGIIGLVICFFRACFYHRKHKQD